MNFLLDENAELRIAGFLRDKGHDVKVIAHDFPASLSDDDVLSIAQAEGRILITGDRDFGELIFLQQLPHSGVIFFRLGDQSLDTKLRLLERILQDHADHVNEFFVVTDRSIRIR